MIVWATEFPLKRGAQIDQLLELAKEWRLHSPHSSWTVEDLSVDCDQKVARVSKDAQSIELARFVFGEEKWIGFRHREVDRESYTWSTEVVGFESREELSVSIQSSCESLKLGFQAPTPKKPFIVKQLFERFGGGSDGSIPVLDSPHFLKESDLDDAAKMITGKAGNRLPVIYVSATWHGEPAVDCESLARWVSGMAHVVIEPSRYFSIELARHVTRRNAYGGAISIYWPSGEARQIRFLPDEFSSSKELASEICRRLTDALRRTQRTGQCDWNRLRELVAAHRLDELRKSGSQAIEDYAEEFDDELNAKQERILQLESKIEFLQYQVDLANTDETGQEGGVLATGRERPLFRGETRDTILKAIRAAIPSFQENGRVRHILEDILEANVPDGECERIRAEIKKVIGGCTKLGGRERRRLEELGFAMRDGGKHIEACFHNDDRYKFTIAKSPGDGRTMKNTAADIDRKLFR